MCLSFMQRLNISSAAKPHIGGNSAQTRSIAVCACVWVSVILSLRRTAYEHDYNPFVDQWAVCDWDHSGEGEWKIHGIHL